MDVSEIIGAAKAEAEAAGQTGVMDALEELDEFQAEVYVGVIVAVQSGVGPLLAPFVASGMITTEEFAEATASAAYNVLQNLHSLSQNLFYDTITSDDISE